MDKPERINKNEYLVGMSIQFTAAILRSGEQLGAEVIGLETADALLFMLHKEGIIDYENNA